MEKNGVLDLSRSLIAVCFTPWWNPRRLPWYQSEKWCRGNDTPTSRRGSSASWGWWLQLSDSGFSWEKSCLLQKNYLFQPKIASSPTSLQEVFFQCALNSYCESTDWAPCACRGTRGTQVSLEIFLPCKKLAWLIYPMKLPRNLKHLSEELIFLPQALWNEEIRVKGFVT